MCALVQDSSLRQIAPRGCVGTISSSVKLLDVPAAIKHQHSRDSKAGRRRLIGKDPVLISAGAI